jgi:hypothetical protein
MLGIVGLSTIGLMIIGVIWARESEKRKWNNGVCSKCKEQWVLFDVDSQGGRMYKCNCGYCNISYNVDKNN